MNDNRQVIRRQATRHYPWVAGLVSLVALASSVLAAAPTARQMLELTNGDHLGGSLQGYSFTDGILWQHPDATEPLLFPSEAVSIVDLGTPDVAEVEGDRHCRFVLNGGDEFSGNLESFDGTNFVIQTAFAGELTIPRSYVHLLRPQPNYKVVFEGPSDIESWTIGDVSVDNAGVWHYANGGFYATKAASIARKVGLPDNAILEFDLAWKETFNLAIALYNDYLQPISLRSKENEPDFGGFYSLQVSPRSVQLLLVTQDQPLKYLGPIAVRAFDNKNMAHVEVRVNRVLSTITLMVDGEVVKQWKDDGPFGGSGRGIRLVHQGQGSCRIRNLKVSEWDGRFDREAALQPNSEQDLLLTVNRGILGKLSLMTEDGRFRLLTSQEGFEVPWDQVVQLELARQDADYSQTPENIRAWFDNRRRLHLRMESWQGDEIVATNGTLGRVTLDAKAFRQIEFLRK